MPSSRVDKGRGTVSLGPWAARYTRGRADLNEALTGQAFQFRDDAVKLLARKPVPPP